MGYHKQSLLLAFFMLYQSSTKPSDDTVKRIIGRPAPMTQVQKDRLAKTAKLHQQPKVLRSGSRAPEPEGQSSDPKPDTPNTPWFNLESGSAFPESNSTPDSPAIQSSRPKERTYTWSKTAIEQSFNTLRLRPSDAPSRHDINNSFYALVLENENNPRELSKLIFAYHVLTGTKVSLENVVNAARHKINKDLWDQL